MIIIMMTVHHQDFLMLRVAIGGSLEKEQLLLVEGKTLKLMRMAFQVLEKKHFFII